MIGDRLDNDIRPARLLGWKTIRIAQGFARFQSLKDGLDDADTTLANVKLLVRVFTGGLAKSSSTLTTYTYCSRSHGPRGCSLSLSERGGGFALVEQQPS